MVWSMSRRKDISYDHRRAVIAAHQSGTSYKAFSKQFSSPPFYSETDSSQVWNIEGSRQSCLVWTSQQLHHEARLRCSEKLQKETQKLHLRTPQASVSMWNAKVQDSRVIKKKKTEQVWLFWKGCLEKASSLSIKNMAAQLGLLLHLETQQDFWSNVLFERWGKSGDVWW